MLQSHEGNVDISGKAESHLQDLVLSCILNSRYTQRYGEVKTEREDAREWVDVNVRKDCSIVVPHVIPPDPFTPKWKLCTTIPIPVFSLLYVFLKNTTGASMG